MTSKLPWYLPNRSVVAVFLTITACFVWQWTKSREIPFDADKWKQAVVSGNIDIRYRMVEDLKAKIGKMETPNFDDLRQLLGPSSSDNHEPRALQYRIGRRLSLLPSESRTFDLRFDENKQLVGILVW